MNSLFPPFVKHCNGLVGDIVNLEKRNFCEGFLCAAWSMLHLKPCTVQKGF